MEVTKKYKVKFTGKCAVCGGTILGWKGGKPTVSFEMAHYYQWRKRDASGNPVSGMIMHIDPTCHEVAAGEMRPSDMRGEPSTTEPPVVVEPLPAPEPEVAPEVQPIVPKATDKEVAEVVEQVLAEEKKAPAKSAARVAAPASKKLTNPAASWEDILAALLNSGVRRIGLTGPAGTGKSTTSYKLLQKLVAGRDVYRVTMTPRTTLEDLLGSFQLVKEDGVTVQKFVMGPVPLALTKGCPLQFDEFTHSGGEVESLFYSVWDDQPQILLADGTYIDKVAPGFCCIGTTNDPPEQLAQPILDRCEAFLTAAKPHPAALADCTEDERAVCMNYYNGLDTKPWQFSRSPSVRMVRSFSRFRKAGLLSDELLAKAVFGNAGAEFLSSLSTAALTRKRGY